MTNSPDTREFRPQLQRLEALLHEAEELTDPAAQACCRQFVRAVLDLHAAGLERLVGHMDGSALDACANEDIVSGLLLLHNLHPQDTETRVRQALEQVRPYLRSHGGNVELLEINGGVARLRLEGSCDHCPSSALTMSQTIEEAILAKAPDVIAVEVEGEPGASASGGTPGADAPGSPFHQRAGKVALPVL